MRFRTIKGVQDILPPDVYLWQEVESLTRQIFSSYGFKEIRPPVMEFTELFMRSIGETTDIVEKEMYTFQDRAGRGITLRPEATAPVVRAYVQNHLYMLSSPQKYYYIGPMFRYERPQKGRFRQFHQIGVEAFGEQGPAMDAEVLFMLKVLLERAGLKGLVFELNSIGCSRCRPSYRESLTGYLGRELERLCSDCKRRYQLNPLRVLDCKVDGCREVKHSAPKITDFLCDDCDTHFQTLLNYLDLLSLTYSLKPDMVRGLDYYTRTIFEVTSEFLGSQNAVAAGGRYDTLVEEFGGPPTPAIGFAIGVERLIELLKGKDGVREPVPDLYISTIGEEAERAALRLSSRIRDGGIWVEVDYSGGSLKSQLRRADKLNASYVIIIGEDEILRGKVIYKRLSDGEQGQINMDEVDVWIKKMKATG